MPFSKAPFPTGLPLRSDNPFFSENTHPYLRDVDTHCMQVAEGIDAYREIATGLLSTYLSSVANRTNDVMKVLTIMASIFIPLTFLAGIYGMNFEYMPETKFRWAYPVLLAVMLVTTLAMLFYFRRKGWIGDGGRGTVRENSRA